MADFGATRRRLTLVHMVIFAVAGIAGVLNGVFYGRTVKYFQKQCLFYANITIKRKGEQGHVTLTNDPEWGSTVLCDFITFEGVLVFMVSFTWFWFCLHFELLYAQEEQDMSPESRKNLKRVSKENYQTCENQTAVLLLSRMVASSILCLSSAIRLTFAFRGYKYFCSNLDCEDIGCEPAIDPCQQLQTMEWVSLPEEKHLQSNHFRFHDTIKKALILSWVESTALAVQLLLVVFDLYQLGAPFPSFSQSGEDWEEQSSGTQQLSVSTPTSDVNYDTDEEEGKTPFTLNWLPKPHPNLHKSMKHGLCTPQNSLVSLPNSCSLPTRHPKEPLESCKMAFPVPVTAWSDRHPGALMSPDSQSQHACWPTVPSFPPLESRSQNTLTQSTISFGSVDTMGTPSHSYSDNAANDQCETRRRPKTTGDKMDYK